MLESLLFCAGFALLLLGALSLIYPLRWLHIRTRAAALAVMAGGFLLVAIGAEMIDSYLAYLGFTLFFAGLISLIRPLRFLFIRDRRWALAVVGLGLFVSLGVLLWPYGSKEATTHLTKLDEWMPHWQIGEQHTIHVAAPPEAVFAAIHAVRADEILFFRTLIAIRRCGQTGPESILNPPEEKPMLDVATQTTFLLLADEPPREIVIGTVVAAPRKATAGSGKLTPEHFQRELPPGVALATMNFLVLPDDRGGSIVSTETRIYANNTSSLRRFAIYWRLIHPGSDIIRRMWLRAIKRRAEGKG